jgi:hypothetical protein
LSNINIKNKENPKASLGEIPAGCCDVIDESHLNTKEDMADQCKDTLHLDIIAPMVQVAARAAARAAMSIDGGIIYSKCTRRNNRPCSFCAHVHTHTC